MVTITKRKEWYYLNLALGGTRVRAGLRTNRKDVAKAMSERVSLALAEGPKSKLWPQLRVSLPHRAYRKLSEISRVGACPVLSVVEQEYLKKLKRRTDLGEIVESSRKLYQQTAGVFFGWLSERGIEKVEEITPRLVEEYQVWRKTKLQGRAQSSSGRGLRTDNTVLNSVFEFAVAEGHLPASPLKEKFRVEDSQEPVVPFTPEEIRKMDEASVGNHRLLYLLLKHTGLRGSDAAELGWSSVDFAQGVLTWKTRKRKTWVKIPLVSELLDELRRAYESRKSGQSPERVLGFPSRIKVYEAIKGLGRLAGVENAHPHRFRHTLACRMLENGATMYEVAQVLGDTLQVVETHYAKFTQKMQDRIRGILEEK